MADDHEADRRHGTMQARYLSRTATYANMGEAFAEQAGGKHWIRTPTTTWPSSRAPPAR